MVIIAYSLPSGEGVVLPDTISFRILLLIDSDKPNKATPLDIPIDPPKEI
jgi:hypothetical protein